MHSHDPAQEIPATPQGGAGNSCPICGLSLPSDTPPESCPRCLLGAGLHGSALHHPEGPSAAGDRFGPYQLGRLVGSGGMGKVYEADDLETGRRVALKILSQRLDSPDARRRFLNEGRIAATINHPHSVYVFGAEEIAGVPVIAMELMPGGTLEDIVRMRGALPATEAADIALQLIDGLAAAHTVGILHRDLKPSNCFVDDDGSVKIGDYGLSISTKCHERPSIGEESFMGTPMFASPEQVRGDELTVRSDIYSLGATLYVLLAGQAPFPGKDMIRLLTKVLESPAPDLSALRPDLPQGLAVAVHRCLEKRPDDRFASCQELRSAIMPFSSQGKTAAEPWQRLAAGTVDMAVIGIPYLIASRLISDFYQGFAAVVIQAVLLVCTMVAWIAWFTWFEWKSGRTPGKALLGLNLQLTEPGQRQWIAGLRILGRSSLFILLPVATACVFFSPVRVARVEKIPVTQKIFGRSFETTETRTHYEWKLGLLTMAAWVGTPFLLFAAANRRNGWLALHDQLTGTRVVSPVGRETPRPALRENESLPEDGSSMLGPFHILEAMPGTDEWHIGYDPKLLRKVWLRKLPPGTPPVAAALRKLRRPGRLRWLAGIRSPEENWDAYEFPGGQALSKLAEQRIPWHQLLPWMSDLANELVAAAPDGTQPGTPSLEQIWITADGRAKLLDFPAPGLRPPSSPSGRPPWLDLTDRLLGHHPLPLPVSAFLKKLGEIQDPAMLIRELEHLAAVPHEVSRARRLGIIAASAIGPLLLGMFLFFLNGTSLPAALFWAVAGLLAFVALPAIITAACAGDGLIMRILGVCVVDRHGHPASGVLASRRSLIAWLPALASPALYAGLAVWKDPNIAGTGTLAALCLLAVVSALLPERTLHDRLAGTWLVPR